MSLKPFLAAMALVGLLGACQSIPREQSVGEFCADARHANRDVCKVNVEIDGVKTALSRTDMRLSEAEKLAASAQSTAQEALNRQDQMFCETRSLRNTRVGTCAPGYTLVSCTQSRFYKKAGGLSIMRAIDDQQCRFHDPVLEMQVRCCMAGAARLPTTPVSQPLEPETPPEPRREPTPSS